MTTSSLNCKTVARPLVNVRLVFDDSGPPQAVVEVDSLIITWDLSVSSTVTTSHENMLIVGFDAGEDHVEVGWIRSALLSSALLWLTVAASDKNADGSQSI